MYGIKSDGENQAANDNRARLKKMDSNRKADINDSRHKITILFSESPWCRCIKGGEHFCEGRRIDIHKFLSGSLNRRISILFPHSSSHCHFYMNLVMRNLSVITGRTARILKGHTKIQKWLQYYQIFKVLFISLSKKTSKQKNYPFYFHFQLLHASSSSCIITLL